MDRLDRFVTAQDKLYDQALGELRRGLKTSHWMWFIFPQIAGLGRSDLAKFYAIRDRHEARAYLVHPVLAPRLAECADAMLAHAGSKSAIEILGEIDATKFRSSMTLFDILDPFGRWGACLDAFYDGKRDPETLKRV